MAMQVKCLIAAVIWLALLGNGALATTHEFYNGKAVRIVVGYAPGGGYDFYARVIARHIGKHIPGNPTSIVENMPGAGSLVSANHLYKLAKADGLTIGHFNGSLFQLQALGQKEIEFDSTKFEYVGSVAKVEIACGFSKASGIDSVEKWMAVEELHREWAPLLPGPEATMFLEFSTRLSVCRCRWCLAIRAPAICAWPWKGESSTVFVPAGRASNRYGNSRLRAEIWSWCCRRCPNLTRICQRFRWLSVWPRPRKRAN